MAPALRLCLVLECTARAGAHWGQGGPLRHLIEPLLTLAEAVPGGCELALVCFGAHLPHSVAAVESSLGWFSSAAQFRKVLLDDLDFTGGGNQPVALAEALLEAATLFGCAPGSSSFGGGGGHAAATLCQQHCLVCLASDPASQPVPWPFAEDCSLAQLPGLAASAELCCVLRRRGILLGLAGPNLLGSSLQLWHLACLVSDAPLSMAEARWDRLKRQLGGDAVQQQIMRSVLSLPSGGGMAALPFWPQALEMLQQQAGAKLVGAGRGAAAGSLAAGGESAFEPPAETEESAAKRARTVPAQRAGQTVASVAPAAAAAAAPAAAAVSSVAAGKAAALAVAPSAGLVAVQPLAVAGTSPEAPPVAQWTPPGTALAQHATPPAGTAPTPGSFWEVLNAEILSPADPVGTATLPTPAVHTPSFQPAAAEPAVPGLPLPPVQAQQQTQQVQQQAAPMQPVMQQQHAQQHAQMQAQQAQQLGVPPAASAAHAPGMLGAPGAGAPLPVPTPTAQSTAVAGGGGGQNKAVVIHTAKVVVDQKVVRTGTLMLGTAQVLAAQQDAAALLAGPWPSELHVTKTISMAAASNIFKTKLNCRRTRLHISWASAEAQSFPDRLISAGAAGLVALYNGAHGVLLPARHAATQQVLLQLVVVPTG